jgi:type IV pilus assembly protein PilP
MITKDYSSTVKHSTKNVSFSWRSYADQNFFFARSLFIVVITIGLIACGGAENADLREYVANIKALKKGRIPPLPEPQIFEIYSYDEESLRDPFIPTQELEAANRADSGLRPDNARVKDVLEEYPLGSLKMMGSLEQSGKRWALLKAPDGTLHRTTKGRHMGHNNGEVLKITENELELKEIVPDGLGGWIERLSTLTTSE